MNLHELMSNLLFEHQTLNKEAVMRCKKYDIQPTVFGTSIISSKANYWVVFHRYLTFHHSLFSFDFECKKVKNN